jgi:hypothetical protein
MWFVSYFYLIMDGACKFSILMMFRETFFGYLNVYTDKSAQLTVVISENSSFRLGNSGE